jgi:hypothetical protein
MAPGAASGRVEPQNHPEQGHGIHPILPSLWRGGCPPHGPGIRVTQSQGLRRGHQPASPRGLAGPIGRGPHRGPDALSEIPAGSEALPSPEDLASRLQRRGPSPKAAPRQPRPPQAIAPWEGPYVVVKVLKPSTYKLANEDGEELTNAWNIQQLRHFYP